MITFVKESNIFFVSLQGLGNFFLNNRSIFADWLTHTVQISNIQLDTNMPSVEESSKSRKDTFVLSRSDVELFLEGAGRWACLWARLHGRISSISALNCCAEAFVNLFAEIPKTVAVRDSCNDSREGISPVFPQELICKNMRRLSRNLEQHDSRPKRWFSEKQIAQIDKDLTGHYR